MGAVPLVSSRIHFSPATEHIAVQLAPSPLWMACDRLGASEATTMASRASHAAHGLALRRLFMRRF